MWDGLVYGALGLAALTTLGALVLLSVRVLQAWRSFKRLRRHVFKELGRVAEKAERALDEVESVSGPERLDRSLARLRASLAQLALLREAVEEATAFTAFVPRK